MNMKRIALLAALMLLFTTFSAFAQPEETTDPVLATVNGENILKSQVDELIPIFVDYKYITDATDYQTVLEYLIQQKVLTKKIHDMGFDQFSEEEQSAFAQEAQKEMDQALAEYADYFQSEDTPEAREAVLKQGEAYFTAQGVTLEKLMDRTRSKASTDRLSLYLTGDYQPSEEEIQAAFLQFGPQYEQTYKNDIPAYEYATQYSDQDSWYTPEGYRGVIQILLNVEEALLSNYQTLSNTLEVQQEEEHAQPEEDAQADEQAVVETASPETTPTEPVTEEMVEQAKQAVLDSRKEDIQMIYDRLARGELFADLVKEYGEDPGMTDETILSEGYPVHKDSVMYDPAFTAAAFSDKMQKPGDVSDPVVSSFGIHILMYQRDIPSGLIMTDAIHQLLEDYLLSMKENEAFSRALDTWKAEIEVIYHQDAIDLAIQQADAQAVTQEEDEPIQAVTVPEEAVETPVVGN